jgi:hypothetical protein
MKNYLPVIRDFSIAVIIAIFTAEKIVILNIIYQTTIISLIAVIIFLILRVINKHSGKLEILSIIYSQSIILPILKGISNGKIKDVYKLYIVLPDSLKSLQNISSIISTFEIYKTDKIEDRNVWINITELPKIGKVFIDTPSIWINGFKFYNLEKELNHESLQKVMQKMNKDIKLYCKKKTRDGNIKAQVQFITADEFYKFFTEQTNSKE